MAEDLRGDACCITLSFHQVKSENACLSSRPLLLSSFEMHKMAIDFKMKLIKKLEKKVQMSSTKTLEYFKEGDSLLDSRHLDSLLRDLPKFGLGFEV